MVNINKKAKVISFPNEYMKDTFSPFLVSLGRKAKNHHDARVQYAYLLKSLDFMQYVDFDDLPEKPDDFISSTLEIEIDGEVYSQDFKLVKSLDKENIYELRINLVQSNWRFRGIFFPYNYNGKKFYCFTFPFEKKKQVQVDLTNRYRDRTYVIYNNLVQSPEKYEKVFR